MRTNTVLTVLTAGLLALTPVAAAAETSPPPTTNPPGQQVDKVAVTLIPSRGVPGTKVVAKLTPCAYAQVKSDGVDLGFTGSSGEVSGTVRAVKPGRYLVTVYCSYANTPHSGVGTAWFTVLDPNPPHPAPPTKPAEPRQGKQITKVPVGAPQTGDGTIAGWGPAVP
ncbi:hypothetical protein HUW46_04345 [Amycolatopsis sp. CA-230715]|nr:hypothetical protein HUW46_04345 [Amycolatopsis sp. CA-230715]